MEKIGITTTIPIEVVYAAGAVPVDLNNVFITSGHEHQLIERAELDGYPRNICGWIKGIYSTVLELGINKVIAVTQGDCSNTHALMETLSLQGVEIIPFAYPYNHDRELLTLQIQKLMDYFGVGWDEVNATKAKLDSIRAKVHKMDELTWQKGIIDSYQNHYFQVCCSDLNSNPAGFEKEVDEFLSQLSTLSPQLSAVRLGYIGVPPIFTDLYQFIESLGARVVFNELQRQFSMPFDTQDLVTQYQLYTYPYPVFGRIEDIKREITPRKIQGIIHYAQTFCFRQIEDLIFRRLLPLPILFIEGDRPSKLDARTRLKIESFVEMLKAA